MKDLISREKALDCFHDWLDKYGDVHTADEMTEYQAIEALPTEKSQCALCQYNDLDWDEEPCESCTGENNHFKAVQPEIIHCEDCKWWEKMKLNDKQGYCHAAKHAHYSANWEISIYRTTSQSFFCADAERREYETD